MCVWVGVCGAVQATNSFFHIYLFIYVVARKGDAVLRSVWGSDGCMPIHLAAKKGFVDVVDFMLAHGCTMEDRDKDPKRAGAVLHYAAWGGALELVRYLLSRGADAGLTDVVGNTPILYSIYGGSRACCEEFMRRGRSLRECNAKHHSAVLQASCGGHLELVRWLLDDHGHSLAERDLDGNTALLFAAWGGHRELMEFLLRRGEDINQANNNGHNVLLSAANGGRTHIVEWLLSAYGFDIEAKNHNNDTALLLACYGGHLALVKRLLELGATRTRNACGFTPLLSAANGSQLAMCAWLLENGSSLDEVDHDHYDALILASCSGSIELVKFFIERGANPNSRNSNGDGALLLASYCSHAPLVAWLLDNGHSSLDEVNHTRMNALISAANGGALDVLHLLLDRMKGQGLEATDEGGYTPLLLAAQRGHLACVQALAGYGANVRAQTTRHHNNAVSLAIDFPEVQAYLQHIWELSPLEIAVDARDIDRVHVLLASGAQPTAAALRLAETTGPYAAAKPPVAEITRMLQLAAKPWSPVNHGLFGAQFARGIRDLLMIKAAVESQGHLPYLPTEVWLTIMSFMTRGFFVEPAPVGAHWVSPLRAPQRAAWRRRHVLRTMAALPAPEADSLDEDLDEDADDERMAPKTRASNDTSERTVATSTDDLVAPQEESSGSSGSNAEAAASKTIAAAAAVAAFRVSWV